ncbi:Tyrosine-protein phosphatase non-receptor type 22 [Varanus komodoensis]|nr:Tyrosine-protein phosphatase non-receptor type 22 [Varanus komodoensis]
MDQREIIMQNLERARNTKLNRGEFTSEFLDILPHGSQLVLVQAARDLEFLKLKRQSATYKADKIYPTATSEMPENISKNRYKDILPYDHSRVKLSLITSDKDSHYINANFIKGVYEPKTYIATQGPLSTTVVDFWRMVWEYKILIIVMACMEFEMGKKKCERYWVEVDETPIQLGPFSIFCEAEEKRSDYVIRTLKVKLNDSVRVEPSGQWECREIRTVYHFHYKKWPDHDVPSSINPILQLIIEMRCYQAHYDVPICVHCSAGCGRTGVICAIDYTRTLVKDGILPMNFSIFNMIQEMRTQRPLLVQTQEQYKLVYDAVIEIFQRQIEILSSHSGTITVETEFYQQHYLPIFAFYICRNLQQKPGQVNFFFKFCGQSLYGVHKDSSERSCLIVCKTCGIRAYNTDSAPAARVAGALLVLQGPGYFKDSLQLPGPKDWLQKPVHTEIHHPTAKTPQALQMETSSRNSLSSSAEEGHEKSWHSGHSVWALDTHGRSRDGHPSIRQALSVGPMSFSASRTMDATARWDPWSIGQPLHKHHSLDFNNLFWAQVPLTLKSGGKTGLSLDTTVPLTRTKSNPFELVSQKTPQMLTRKDPGSYLGIPFGSFQVDSSLSNTLSSKVQRCRLRKLRHQPCTWSAEDPYFSSISSEEPCSPEFPDSTVDLPETVPPFSPAVDLQSSDAISSHLPCNSQAQSTYLLDVVESACQNSPQLDEEIPPPLPERTPESFIIPGEDDNSLLAASNNQPALKIEETGVSKEWSCMSQLKFSDDSVRMRPSKGKKLQRPSSEFYPARSPSPPPPPLPERTPESFILADEESQPSVTNSVVSFKDSGTKSTDVSSKEAKCLRRSKSLKILRNVKNSICGPSSLVKTPGPDKSNHSRSVLSFGFANQFSKPKGPRDPPPNWNI